MTQDADLAALERQIWDVTMRLSHCRFGDFIAKDTGYDLPPASWNLLEFLDRGGPVRVSDIAAYNEIDVSSVTPRLKALETQGFLERGADPADGRVSLITITEKGREVVARMHAARCKLFADGLQGVDRGQIGSAAVLLKQLADWLEKSDA